MAAFEVTRAWLFKYSGPIGTVVTVGVVGLNWFFTSKSNKRNIREIDVKIEKYHVENRVERIAGEERLRDFIHFGLSKDISNAIQGKKDDKKDGKD